MTVVSFLDVTPPERTDGHPWVSVRIEEAPFKTGPWTIIEAISLDPVDPDPAVPVARNFTTAEGSLENGWYRLLFMDGNAGISAPSEPLLNAPDYALPDLREVGRRIMTRTRTAGGNLLGTFTAATPPCTPDVVQGYIEDARDVVYGKIGIPTDPDLARNARQFIAIYAAMEIELGLFSEQVAQGTSPYDKLKDLYDEGMEALIEALGGEGNSAVDDGTSASGNPRMGSFGDTGELRVGMRTLW